MHTAISIELVPRSIDGLLRDARLAATFPHITHVNIPDLPRFPVRSTEATALLRAEFGDRFVYVPHIPVVRLNTLHHQDVPLVVQGDIPDSFQERISGTSLELIGRLCPHYRVMAVIDQYRSGPLAEISYVNDKIIAGTAGFFTQPFFSVSHAAYWAELLPDGVDVFYGISPVTTEGSRSYWKDKNRVVFPRDFSLSIEWNITHAREMLGWVRSVGQSAYLMPIRISLAEYLSGIFL